MSEEAKTLFKKQIEVLARGANRYGYTVVQNTLRGSSFIASLTVSVAPGYEKTWGKVIISILDITDQKNLEDRLRFMSFHDPLTGIYNRAYFEEEIQRLEVGRQYPVALLVCDMDNLKTINDTQGHEVGDQAIRSMSIVLNNSARNEDVVARMGGDEFALIFPKVNDDTLQKILARIENAIAVHNAITIDDGLYRPLKISIGAVSVSEEESIAEGYIEADHLMYLDKSKRKGEK